MINLPPTTPTSLLYIAGAGVAAYFSNEVAPLRWLAYSAAMMFMVRGPLRYFLDQLVSVEEDVSGDFKTLLRVVIITGLVGQWVCFLLVGYWVYKFALSL